MNIAGLVQGVEKNIVRDIIIQLISGFLSSFGADALAAKTFNKKLGDQSFVAKIKRLFASGMDDEALESLRVDPSGRGRQDEAVTINAFLSGLRRFQDGIYAVKADELASFFGEDTPEKEVLREKFRLTWILLDNIQQLEVLAELALMPNDEMRMNYIRTSGALDMSIRDKKLTEQIREQEATNAQIRADISQIRSKSLWQQFVDGDLFRLF